MSIGEIGMSEPRIAIAMIYHSLRDGALQRALNALGNLDYPKNKIDLILIDNHSRDGAREFVEEWLNKRINEYAKVIHLKEAGNVPHLRNVCLNIALQMGHEFLMFVDSDIILTPDSLRRLLNIYEKREDKNFIFAISFPYVTPINKLDLIWRIRIKYEYPYSLINKGIVSLETVGVSATLINLSLVPKVGFFDEEIPLIEDLDYIRRATKLGYKAICDTDNPLLHDKHVKTLPYLKQILLKQGKPEAKILLKHKLLRKALRGLIYWNLLLFSIPFTIMSPIPFLLLFIIGYIVYALRLRGWGKIIGFPIIAIYRMALNLSILYGLIFFTVRQKIFRAY